MVPMNIADIANLRDPGLRETFFTEYDDIIKKQGFVARMFRMLGSMRYQEHILSMAGIGGATNFTTTGQVTYNDVSEGYKKTFTPVEWTNGFKVKKSALDDDLYGVLDSAPKLLAEDMARTREEHGITIFSGAFSGTDGPDSLSLCNSAHTSTVDGIGTQSNTGTDKLTKTTLSSTRLAMLKYASLAGKKSPAVLDTILVPVDEEQNAIELVKTTKDVGTDNNNINFHYGRYTVIANVYLADMNNWFGKTDPLYIKDGVMYVKN